MTFDERQEFEFLKLMDDNILKDLSRRELENRIAPHISPHYFNKLFTRYEAEGLLFQHLTTNDGIKLYSLSNTGKDLLKHFLKMEEDENLKNQKLIADVQKVTDEVVDYPETKYRAKWGYNLSWIAIGLTLIMILQKWMCNKPG